MITFFAKDDGFTLIEVLLVLALVSLLATFPVMHFAQLKKETETQLFFEALRSGITLIQTEAVVNDHWTNMEVRPTNRLIRFRVTGTENTDHPANHILYLPESISLYGTSKEYLFSKSSGNLGNINELNFSTIHGRVTVSFQMGSGRFVIE
ncbi:prepilin-type N-terminal cleavage/methylation domain-containing protein [Alkalibacterium subtropicum]|uniref:Prepilin-type N-terminal cleavage/methylation domain-containing protein n=1 Tax=Alkalibacterium subtropicum TaxID=753702 RepID=A0A1I1GRI5_9LACT|nr:competence type IV pilus minor pilin ComGD [Alkalibacterium subtropicum]SFC14075.1 prepilin-type N-terminal cleavage/methylation domain-containing protein [Alkalibacterium subtropicum]